MNGWQRLWVVGTVALGIFTIGYGAINLDTKNSLMRYHEAQVDWKRTRIETIRADRSRAPYGATPEQAIADLKGEIVELDNTLERELKTVTPNLIQGVFILFGLWLGASALIYAVGITINWVYRGFRPKRV